MNTNVIELIIKGTDNASSVVEGVLGKITGTFDKVAGGLLRGGAMLGLALAPVTAALTSATNEASVFQESMTNVQAVLGATDDQVTTLSDDILLIGANSRAGPQAAAEAFYDIVGGVADANSHMAILQASIKTSEAGAAALGTTTSALISIMNSYSFAADDASYASDVLTRTVGMGVGSMEDFATALPQVAGLASSLKIDFEDLGAATAFLTTKGFSASQAATQLRAMMTALLNPNVALKKAFQEVGFASGTAAIEQLGLVGAYQALIDKSPTFQNNMAGAIGSVEALNGVIALTGGGFDAFSTQYTSALDGATDAAQQIQLGSVAAQTDLLKSSLSALRIEVGTALLPAVTSLVSHARPVITTMTEWVAKNPELIVQLGSAVGALAGLSSGMVAAGTAMKVVMALAGALTSPIGLLITIGTGLYMAWKNNFLGIQNIVAPVVNRLTSGFTQIGRTFNVLKSQFEKGGLEQVVRTLFGGSMVEQILTAFGMDGTLATAIGDGLRNVFIPLANGDWRGALDGLVNGFADLSRSIVDKLIEIAPGVLTALETLGAALFAWIVATAPKVAAQLLEWGKTFVDWIGPQIPPLLDKLGQLAGSLLEWIAAAVPQVIAKLLEWGKAFVEWVAPQIPPLLEKLGQLAADLITWVIGQIPGIIEKLTEWGKEFVNWVAPAAADLLLALPGLSADMLEWVLSVIPDITVQLLEWAALFVDWVGPAAVDLLVALAGLSADLINWILADFIPAITAEIPGVVDALISFAADTIDKVPGAMEGLITSIANFITNTLIPGVWDSIKSIGTALIDGIKEGINDAWDGFTGWLEDKLSGGIVGDVADFLGLGSPSRIYAYFGEMLIAGLQQGLEKTGPLRTSIDSMLNILTPEMPQPVPVGGGGMGGGTYYINVTVPIDAETMRQNPNAHEYGREWGRGVSESLRDELSLQQRFQGGGVVS